MGGSELAEARVFLYHPPFQLDVAVSYVAENGKPREIFTMPRGWGVLRSRCGLLLWLKLSADAALTAAARSNVQANGQPLWRTMLRLEFCATAAGVKLESGARAVERVFGPVQLGNDEGVLFPATETNIANCQVKLCFDSEFGEVAMLWLSEALLHS